MDLLIGNRRYTGSKKALLNDIYKSVAPFCKKGAIFGDIFAGTGAVAMFMAEKGLNIVVNDILYSNCVAYDAWMGKGKYNKKKINDLVEKFNKLDGSKLKENYFSNTYGDKYFSRNDAKKIGFIRDQLETIPLTHREKNIMLTSLIYSTDKIANTVGHFEHYLSKKPTEKGVVLRNLNIAPLSNEVSIYNEDSNNLVKKINCDIVYIDPPYNARQYINFYHVLENLARWEKPTEFEGISMKFKRNHLKSDYSKSKAPLVFKDLIENIKAKVIVVSYNNTYSAKSTASNNKISEKQIMEILQEKGTVTRTEIAHKSFNSGKTNFKNHIEFLYICKVNL